MIRLSRLYFAQLYQRPILLLALVAAILYSSWPLGYILNPFVGTHDLASQLEATHQPYNWLFIVMDVLAGLVVTIIAVMQINRNAHNLIRACVIGYGIFGLLVTVAALTPLNCNISSDTCGPVLRNPELIIHGGASILSVGFLFLSTLALGATAIRENMKLGRWIFGTVIAAWIFFGFGSLVELRFHNTGNSLQEFFISICSVTVLLVIGFIEHNHAANKEVATAKQSVD